MKVWVGPFRYKVKSQDRMAQEYGFCTVEQGVIRYSLEQDQNHQRESVMHELLHCIIDQTSERTRSKDDQEATISNISPLLVQVLRDNANLVDFLVE